VLLTRFLLLALLLKIVAILLFPLSLSRFAAPRLIVFVDQACYLVLFFVLSPWSSAFHFTAGFLRVSDLLQCWLLSTGSVVLCRNPPR